MKSPFEKRYLIIGDGLWDLSGPNGRSSRFTIEHEIQTQSEHLQTREPLARLLGQRLWRFLSFSIGSLGPKFAKFLTF